MSTKLKFEFSFSAQGDSSVLVRLSGADVTVLCRHVHKITNQARSAKLRGVTEIVPAYSSLAVYYEPRNVSYQLLCSELNMLILSSGGELDASPSIHTVPVCYGGELGPDLDYVAQRHSLSIQDVIERHRSPIYTVAMIGFTPGFPYLLGLPETLATPRRDRPRQRISAGSIGIGGAQTGIYSLDSPGGWNIIGRTPLRLFSPENDPCCLLTAGDFVMFDPIDEAQYESLKQSEENGSMPDDQRN
jgi:inhibitor of KinA